MGMVGDRVPQVEVANSLRVLGGVVVVIALGLIVAVGGKTLMIVLGNVA